MHLGLQKGARIACSQHALSVAFFMDVRTSPKAFALRAAGASTDRGMDDGSAKVKKRACLAPESDAYRYAAAFGDFNSAFVNVPTLS
jgi:hypothetical protein